MRDLAGSSSTATSEKHLPAPGKGAGRVLEQQLQGLCVSLLQVLKRKNARRALLLSKRNSNALAASSASTNYNIYSSRASSSIHPPFSVSGIAMSGKQGMPSLSLCC